MLYSKFLTIHFAMFHLKAFGKKVLTILAKKWVGVNYFFLIFSNLKRPLVRRLINLIRKLNLIEKNLRKALLYSLLE